MLTRRTEIRLRKLEGIGRSGAVFFLAWGRDVPEIEAALAAARAAGEVERGDIVVRALWTGSNGTPPSRWIMEGALHCQDPEFVALEREVERRWPGCDGSDVPSPDFAALTNLQLFAKALGGRL